MRIALVCLLLAGCQTTANLAHQPAETHSLGEPVAFGGFDFMLEKASMADSFKWNRGLTEVTSESGFVLCELSAKNLGSKPVPHALMPLPRLIDEAGQEYEPSLEHSIQFNLPKQVSFGGLNPGVTRTWTYVFEAPPKPYKLQIITPSVATAGFMNESMNVRGKFFYYDLVQVNAN